MGRAVRQGQKEQGSKGTREQGYKFPSLLVSKFVESASFQLGNLATWKPVNLMSQFLEQDFGFGGKGAGAVYVA